jgi:UDP-N-acetylglucosamine 2-epimerase (non-hydrolysing)
MHKPVVLIIGTRPEGIKMIPVYFALQEMRVPVLICSTAQHNELLNEVYNLFGITPDFNLNIMQPGQDLFHITTEVLSKTKKIFTSIDPALVVVQGDTTSSMAAALAAFYLHIPVGHVEAGLRTADINYPFPEEFNRRTISLISKFHFAPTANAVGNLLGEGISRDAIFCTGNTVVDALRIIRHYIKSHKVTIRSDIEELIVSAQRNGKQIVLLTTHRRESFNGGIENILHAMKLCAQRRPDIMFIYPYHPNPNIVQAITSVAIKQVENIHVIDPLSYKDLVYVLLHSDWVASDSGGICEEAVSLGKPVLILRKETERMEGVWAGCAYLVGTDLENILQYMLRLADTTRTQSESHVFGDGFAAEKIVRIITNACNQSLLSSDYSSGQSHLPI